MAARDNGVTLQRFLHRGQGDAPREDSAEVVGVFRMPVRLEPAVVEVFCALVYQIASAGHVLVYCPISAMLVHRSASVWRAGLRPSVVVAFVGAAGGALAIAQIRVLHFRFSGMFLLMTRRRVHFNYAGHHSRSMAAALGY